MTGADFHRTYKKCMIHIIEIYAYEPRTGLKASVYNYCDPCEKLDLASGRNQLAQTNGLLFRRPQVTSEGTTGNMSDIFMFRCRWLG